MTEDTFYIFYDPDTGAVRQVLTGGDPEQVGSEMGLYITVVGGRARDLAKCQVVDGELVA